MSRGYLLVRVDGRPYGLPLSRVLEVSDLAEVLDAPRAVPAVRGLTTLRGRLVPIVHLGALLGGRAAPERLGRTVVLVRLGEGDAGGAGGAGVGAAGRVGGVRQVAFEVDDADEVVREDPLPVPQGQHLPWATGVARPRGGGLVPILDVAALEDRIR